MKKTALVLSGGGSRGGYEIGVWQALNELGIPIHIVTGASVGSINGAMVAQGKPELSAQLWETLETHMIFDLDTGSQKQEPDGDHTAGENNTAAKTDTKKEPLSIGGIPSDEALAYAREIIKNGGAGHSGLSSLLREYIDEEAVRSSPVEYGLVTVEFPEMKPHYLFIEDIPEGMLCDYILASASCFPAVQVMEIGGEKFIDGGYADVMPVEMAMKKGAEQIIAVDLQAAGFQRRDTLDEARRALGEDFRIIKSSLDLGNFLVFDTQNTRRLIRLGYLDAMKSFGKFSGKKYTFLPNAVSPRDLDGAENAAEIFHLSPTEIYSKKTFRAALAEALQAAPDPDFDSLPSIEEIPDLLHLSSLVLLIAEDLKEKEADSYFLDRTIFRLLKEQITAANYLLKNGLV